MNNLRSFTTLIALGALTALGCGARADGGATDTNTNWLRTCVEDPDCGDELLCLCGVCTLPCDDNACDTLSGDAICRTDTAECGEEAAAICALEETLLAPVKKQQSEGRGGGGDGGDKATGGRTGGSGGAAGAAAATGAAGAGGSEAGGSNAGGSGGAAGAGGSEAGGSNAGGQAAMECATPAGTDFPAEEYVPPAGCSLPFDLTTTPLITSESEFQAKLNCAENSPSGVDFTTRQIYLAVAQERLESSLSYVHINDAGDIVVGLVSPVYCGGAAPPNTYVPVLMDRSFQEPTTSLCTSGKCTGLPVP